MMGSSLFAFFSALTLATKVDKRVEKTKYIHLINAWEIQDSCLKIHKKNDYLSNSPCIYPSDAYILSKGAVPKQYLQFPAETSVSQAVPQ